MLKPNHGPEFSPRPFQVTIGVHFFERPNFLVASHEINGTTTAEAVVVRRSSYWQLDSLETELSWRRRKHATFLMDHVILRMRFQGYHCGMRNEPIWNPLYITESDLHQADGFFQWWERHLTRLVHGESRPYLGEYT